MSSLGSLPEPASDTRERYYTQLVIAMMVATACYVVCQAVPRLISPHPVEAAIAGIANAEELLARLKMVVEANEGWDSPSSSPLEAFR